MIFTVNYDFSDDFTSTMQKKTNKKKPTKNPESQFL